MNRLFGLSTRGVLVVVPAMFVAAFFLYPVATILWRGLGGGGGETFLDLAASSRQRDIAWFTIWQAIAQLFFLLEKLFRTHAASSPTSPNQSDQEQHISAVSYSHV